MVNGRLLQTNKKFSHLKQAQKEKLYRWLVEVTEQASTKDVSKKKFNDDVLFTMMNKLEEAQIHLPLEEIEQFIRKRDVKSLTS